MHDWRNFNIVSLESTMIILYDSSMTTVIHPTTWSQHTFVLGFCLQRFKLERIAKCSYFILCTQNIKFY